MNDIPRITNRFIAVLHEHGHDAVFLEPDDYPDDVIAQLKADNQYESATFLVVTVLTDWDYITPADVSIHEHDLEKE